MLSARNTFAAHTCIASLGSYRLAGAWPWRALAGLLLAALLLLPAASGASAAPQSRMFAVTLTQVFVSGPDDPYPAATPLSVPQGGKFKAWYQITNPYSTPVMVKMGVTLRSPYATVITDAAGGEDVPCTVPAERSFMCTRTFTLRSDAAVGPQGLHMGIGLGQGGQFNVTGAFDYGDWIIVVAAPSLTVSPVALDLGAGNGPASLEIRNEGAGTLTWTAAGDQPWLIVSPQSGSGNAALTVSANRAGLLDNFYRGIVAITSNGGKYDVQVRMQVVGAVPPVPPVPVGTPAPEVAPEEAQPPADGEVPVWPEPEEEAPADW